MRRHAYCILAHNDLECLQSLINMIDDERNDIYLMIDKKADYNALSSVKTCKSGLIIADRDKLIDARWGTISIVASELSVFELAIGKGSYEYIHLLSGQDLPIKCQDDIFKFFDSLPKGTNLIDFPEEKSIKTNLEFKSSRYHIAINNLRHRNRVIRKIYHYTWLFCLKIQSLMGIRRRWNGLKLYAGAEWVSISSDFAKYLVENKDFILHKFRMVYCPDEVYKQTMFMLSDYKDTLYRTAEGIAWNGRSIDWKRGYPYIWREKDFDELMNSDCLFARKFSSKEDNAIIDKLRMALFSKNNSANY